MPVTEQVVSLSPGSVRYNICHAHIAYDHSGSVLNLWETQSQQPRVRVSNVFSTYFDYFFRGGGGEESIQTWKRRRVEKHQRGLNPQTPDK